jgi:DNA topoisomerase-1
LLNGRYGAYLKIGKDNFKLPKDTTPENLSLEECIHISKNQAPKSAKKKVFKKK